VSEKCQRGVVDHNKWGNMVVYNCPKRATKKADDGAWYCDRHFDDAQRLYKEMHRLAPAAKE
jgi:hypothetical protein